MRRRGAVGKSSPFTPFRNLGLLQDHVEDALDRLANDRGPPGFAGRATADVPMIMLTP
jgi:hypothetical protein